VTPRQTDWTPHPTAVGVLTCVVAVIERDPPAGRTFAARRVWTVTALGRPGDAVTLRVHSLTAHTRWHPRVQDGRLHWPSLTMGIPRDVREELERATLDWIARTGGRVPSLQELADATLA